MQELCRALEGTKHWAHLGVPACPPPSSDQIEEPYPASAPAPPPAAGPGAEGLLEDWCPAVDAEASGWGALPKGECMRRAARLQAAAAEAVRLGNGTLVFKHIHKVCGSQRCCPWFISFPLAPLFYWF